MRVKAFSLIEIIVVIVLIGIIFSLVLTTYTSKKNINKNLSIKDIPLHVKQDGILFMYGKDCKKAIIELKDGFYASSSNFGYKKENIVIQKNTFDLFEKVDFEVHEIEKRKEDICFKLDFKNQKFSQKFIISTPNKKYLFSPFYQEVKEFDSLEDVKSGFEKESLIPKSADDYYHE